MALLEINRESIQSCPKVVLHDHLDGGLRPETIIELAADNKYQHLPCQHPDDLSLWMLNTAKQGNLELYLEAFTHTVGVMQTAEALTRVAKECVEDLHDDGVIYAELRFAPELFQREGLTLHAIVKAVLDGFELGKVGRAIIPKAILCAMRSETRSLEIAELAADFLGEGVVGFDIAGAEIQFPPRLHLEAFKFAKAHNVPITIHAGEAAGPNLIEEAVDVCGANRIGHGVSIANEVTDGSHGFEMGSIAEFVVNQKIPLEICPTSNLHTGVVGAISDHPVDMLMRAGFQITINTDNRLMSSTSMSNEIWECHEAFGWTWNDIKNVTEVGVHHSFISQTEKDKLLQEIGSWYEENTLRN